MILVIVDRWCAFTDYFDFDTDVFPSSIASAVCREKWSKEFFQRLKAFVLAFVEEIRYKYVRSHYITVY